MIILPKVCLRVCVGIVVSLAALLMVGNAFAHVANKTEHTFSQVFTCVSPKFNSVTVTSATCKTGGGGNNDAKIALVATGADKYGISQGATYAGPDYAAAKNLSSGAADSLNITNASSLWTIRVFNGDNTCFKDTTVVLNCNRCVEPCTNMTILVGEITNAGEKVIIQPLDPNSGTIPCSIPNTGGDGIAIDQVNKIAYIGSPFSSPIKVYSFAQATFFPNVQPSSGTNSFDITLSEDKKYLLRGGTNGRVEKIRIQNGQVVVSRATSFFSDGQNKIWGVAAYGGKVYVTTGYNDLNTAGRSTVQVMDSTFSNPVRLRTRNDGKIYVGITVDKDGTLWTTVDGYGNGDAVEHLTAEGALIKSYPITSSNQQSRRRPFDIDFGPDGNLYVATFYGDCVSKLTLDSPSNPDFGKFSTYLGFEQGVLSKNLAFVCGDVICPCDQPTIAVKVTDPTCESAGKLELTAVTKGNKFGISKGATYTGPSYANATTLPNTFPLTLASNINTTADSTWTVRVFNQESGCYKDTTVTIKGVRAKSLISMLGTPTCSDDALTYSFTFSVTNKLGTVKVNKGTLTGNNPYTVTGIPSGEDVIITDSSSTICKSDTTVTGLNCNCNPSLPKVITSSFTICIGDSLPTLQAAIVGLATVEWFSQSVGGDILATGLTYKPTGIVTGTTTYYAQARSTDPACPVAISTSRTSATINADTCTIDLALKKFIDKKIAQIGDTLTYTIKVWNESNKGATGVSVTDSLATTVAYLPGSFVASRGSAAINGNVIQWTIGEIAANGDTVTLTYKIKAIQEGIHFNTAQICTANEQDVDSTPCNNTEGEDDIDRECFTVPFKLCPTEKIEASVPSKYTSVQWYKDGGTTPIATGNVILLSDVGVYTFTATNQTCPAEGCCPIIIEEGLNCCPVELCIPFTIKQSKKAKK